MSLSLAERFASMFRRQPPQRSEVGNSEIINPADSILGQEQPKQTIIRPLKIRIEPETPPIVLDESGQIVVPEIHQKYSKILPESQIINPGSGLGQQAKRNTLVIPDNLPLRNHPIPRIVRRLAGK